MIRWLSRAARTARSVSARCDAAVRLLGLLGGLVLALALFGLTLRGVVAHRLDATDDLVSQHGRALATAQELRAALSKADAAAAAEVFAPIELLVDQGDSTADLRRRYDGIKNDGLFASSVADSARDVLALRRLDPGLCPSDPAVPLDPDSTDPAAAATAGPGSGTAGSGTADSGTAGSGTADPGSSGRSASGPAQSDQSTTHRAEARSDQESSGPAHGRPAPAGPRPGQEAAHGDAATDEAPSDLAWSDLMPLVSGPGGDEAAPPPAPAAVACPLDILAEGIPVYNGMVERARANDRAGLSVGEANLRAASTMMRTQILPATEVLVARYADAVDSAYQRATGARGEWAVVVASGIAILALAGVQLLLVRRTNRLVNPGLLLATGCVLTAVIWTAVAFGTQQTRLDTARDAGYRSMTLLARSKTLALEARVDENLSLTALGNGTRFDEHFAWVARGLGFDPQGDRLPPEPVTRRGSLVVALDSPEGAGMPAGMEDDLRAWLRIHASVLALLASSPDSVVAAARGPGDIGSAAADPQSSDAFGQAVTRTLGPGTDAFTSFLNKIDTAIDASRDRFEGDVRRAAVALVDLELAGPALVLAAIVAAAAGMWPRLREFL